MTCSSESALSYRWTNIYSDPWTVTYGRTVNISQHGAFDYTNAPYS